MRTRLLLTALTSLVSILPLAALADCSAEIAEIDRRIATGTYPEQNVLVARQMRTSIEQMCAYLTDDARASMMEGIEDVLPVKSEAQRRAEQRVRSAELAEKRRAKKQAAAEAASRRAARVSPVVQAPPTVRSVATTILERDEIMYYTHAWDWALHDGNLRLLYTSSPDRSQFSLPDWSVNVYVAEMTPEGKVTHSHVVSEQSSEQIGFALRRGHDELFRLRQVPRSEVPRALERWSIPGRRLLSSVDLTKLEWNAGGRRWRPPTYQVATSDGHLLFAASEGGGRKDRQIRLAWFKLSPEARILGSDVYETEDSASPWAWFWTGQGGGGLIVNVSPVDATDLASAPRLGPEERSLGSLTAHVTREKRLLIVGPNGRLSSDAVVIERDIMPLADSPSEPESDPRAMLEAMQRQQQWSDDLGVRHDANRSTRSMNVGLRRVEMVRETKHGYAVLTDISADRDRSPPVHGPWIIEFDREGRTTGRLHFQQLAEDLNVRFDGFAPAPGGGYYLHAPQSRQIVRVDAEGTPLARREGQRPDVREEGLVADANGIWLFGHVFEGTQPSRVYLERIEFGPPGP